MKTANKQHAFTLIELMIAITVGLIILAAIGSLFVSMLTSDKDSIKAIHLNQELRAAMSLMARDIRRAGANRASATNGTTTPPTNPFSIDGGNRLAISGGGNTITYSYDSDEANEDYGYKLGSTTVDGSSVGVIESLYGTWTDITDPNTIEITNLNFTDTTTTDTGINLRKIRINLSGRLRNDTTVSRTLIETVKIRNDELN